MRADIGFLLIGVGLVGVYLILSGKFPPKAKGTNTETATPTPSTGDAGVSYKSALRLHRLSTGGMR